MNIKIYKFINFFSIFFNKFHNLYFTIYKKNDSIYLCKIKINGKLR